MILFKLINIINPYAEANEESTPAEVVTSARVSAKLIPRRKRFEMIRPGLIESGDEEVKNQR